MAIGTGDGIDKFGTRDTITTGTPGSIANNTFSAAGDVAVWTNDDDAPYANFTLKCQWATITGVANKRVIVYARLIDIDGTNDEVAPSTSRKSHAVGAFNVYAAATGTDYQFTTGVCRLPAAAEDQKYEFYLENLTGQTISSGWSLTVCPIAYGPV